MARSNLTPEQLQDAQRLRDIWNLKKDALHLTQNKLAEFIGVKQSTIHGYLNGNWALNPSIAASFARLLNCSVADFSPTLQKEIDLLSAFSSSSFNVTSALLESVQQDNHPTPILSKELCERIRALPGTERLRLEGAIEALLMEWEKNPAPRR